MTVRMTWKEALAFLAEKVREEKNIFPDTKVHAKVRVGDVGWFGKHPEWIEIEIEKLA